MKCKERQWLTGGTFLLICVTAVAVRAGTPETPQSPDGSAKVALFAAEPEIVTPIGAIVDKGGRLLVIESNSHFRPKNYQGPPTDRIRILEDTHGAGKADRITTFFEGMNLMMNLATDRDGSVVVSSRDEIFRLLVSPGSGTAARKVSLAHLETTATYPHNGLAGLAVDGSGSVYFGIGENYGAPWTLVGTDGHSIHEETGSGSVFRMDGQGRGLIRVAKGMWNPFGLGFDPAGNLWAVDNDPDGRPPSRLLQIVPGADYGFEFRYGRTGMHPLQAWDGELPGTLGMVTGVGEGPCNVCWHDGHLYVSSWRDHQIEKYTLIPRGAGYRASMQPVVVGDADFRPVGLAFAPDGTLFVTDWGSASYEINHKGRVWKVTFSSTGVGENSVPHTEAMDRAQHLRQSTSVEELESALADPDLAIRQAAQYGLSRLPAVEKIDLKNLAAPDQRIGLMAALLWRGADARPLVNAALDDPDVRVREMGVRVVTEQGIKEARAQIEHMLDSPVMSSRLLRMISAAIAQLDGDPAAKINSANVNGILLSKLKAKATPDASKAVLLRMLPPEGGVVSLDLLSQLLDSKSPALQLEAVRSLSELPDPNRFPLLSKLAESDNYRIPVRAEAVVGLGADASRSVDLLIKLAGGDSGPLRQEALRSLRAIGPKLTAAQRQQLEKIARAHPTETEMLNRLLGRAPSARPMENNTPAWEKILQQAPGDPQAGRRIFFHPSGPVCYRCHTVDGRGRAIGPDLTMIGHSQDPSHILESILDPSKEIAPLYTMWSITTKSGQKIDGMLLRRDGQENEIYVDATGQETKVSFSDIVDRRMRKESVMPSGLVATLTDQELRDLIAMLAQKR